MPELPEVETVRRGLAPAMEGGRLVRLTLNRPDLRFAFPAGLRERLEGRRVTGLGRRAKYLTISFDNGRVAVSHLGMSGSWRVESNVDTPATPGVFHHPRGKIGLHDHIIMDMVHDNGDCFQIIYNDPRRFGFFFDVADTELAQTSHFKALGVEPTGNALSAAYVAGQFAGKTTPIKAALLDQRIIAGLGNIYVCEALWRSQISPRRQARTLVRKDATPTVRLTRLVDAVRAVIAEAIDAGGSSLRDHRQTDGTLGYFQHRFSAYDRLGAACGHRDCSGTIVRIVQSGRSTFYCPACQR